MCAWRIFSYNFSRSSFPKSLQIATPVFTITPKSHSCHVYKNIVCSVTSFPAISVNQTEAFVRKQTITTMEGDKRKTVCLADYDAYGFDLDHTLAKYKLVEFFDMVYSCLTNFLVDKKGYDPKLKTDLQKYKDFICKGLFLDIEKGNIFKLADDGKILKAVHGTKELTVEQLKSEYGDEIKWEHAETVKKMLRNQRVCWRFFENYFDTPGLVAMARIIDILDSKAENSKADSSDYSLAWQDVLEGLIEMYTFTNYAEDKGEFFPIFKNDASKYIDACSNDIKKWLKSLKQDNKVVFLMTSSYIDFAGKTLEASLGPDWATYFDISIFYARKPSYFTDTAAHHILEDGQDKGPVDELKKNGCYSRGNHKELMKFISEQTGKENPQVVYFGDNICADCYPAKMHAGWGTVLLLEEMDAEGYTCSDGTVPDHEDDRGDEEPVNKRLKLPHFEHSSLITPEEREYLLSNFWDTFLYHEDTVRPKKMNTFWGSVISEYSCITVPSLEYLAGVPLCHQFESFNATSGNTRGFHPGRPASLLP